MHRAASFRIFIAGAVLLLFSSPTAAANIPFNIERLTERVVPDSEVTYLRLVREIFPDTEVDENGESAAATRSIKLRRLSNTGFSVHNRPMNIVRVRGWRFLAQGGANHLALLIEAHKEVMEDDDLFDWQYALAVFSYASLPKKEGRASTVFRLVEAVDPQEDRFVDLPDGLPLLEENSGSQSLWIINQHHNASESFRDYKSVKVQSGRSLRWLIKGLPGLHDTEGCEAREESRFDVSPRHNLPKAYLPVEIRLKTLRWKKIDCRGEEGASADAEETRVFLIRSVTLPDGRKSVRIENEQEQRRKAKALSGGVERFEGELLVGKTYTATFIFDETSGWRLTEPIKLLPHHAARIEWIDKKRILSSLIKENRYQLEFKVLARNVRRAGNTNRWNTTYKCVLREALILIPPKESDF